VFPIVAAQNCRGSRLIPTFKACWLTVLPRPRLCTKARAPVATMPESNNDSSMSITQRGLLACQRMLARTTGQDVATTKDVGTRWLSTAAPVNSVNGKVMHLDLLNDNLKKTQYAVRGELYLRAEQLRKEGKDIIFTNGKPLSRSSMHEPLAWTES
jgi:hypothetical protein